MAAAAAQYYFRFHICSFHCLKKVKIYEQTKFRLQSQFTAEMSLLPVWKSKCPLYWNSGSGLVFDHFTITRRIILHQAAQFRPNQTTQRPSTMLHLLWGNSGPPMKCFSWS